MTDIPTVRRQELGEQLRLLRTKAGFTLEQAAQIVNCSASKLSRLETGHRSTPIEDIAGLLAFYRANHTQREHLLALARAADHTGWLQSKDPANAHSQHTLSALASKANQIVCFDPVAVPWLLQTNEYRASVLAESATAASNDIANCHRAISTRRMPPQLRAIVEESVLHRPVGGRQVLQRQLHHLREAASDRNWAIRVVPRGRTIITGPFTVLRQPDRSPVVILEHLTCRLFLERPHDIDAYEHALKHLDTQALDEGESLELISSAAEALEQVSKGL